MGLVPIHRWSSHTIGMMINRKNPPVGGFFHCVRVYKPNSVPCLATCDSHLSGIIVTDDLERHFHLSMDTALHTGKDFAVAPSCCHEDYPLGIFLFFR